MIMLYGHTSKVKATFTLNLRVKNLCHSHKHLNFGKDTKYRYDIFSENILKKLQTNCQDSWALEFNNKLLNIKQVW
jgi:hypothetical protein